MINTKQLLPAILLSLATTLLSACGGGGTAGETNNTFTSPNNTNTKPQTSSVESSTNTLSSNSSSSATSIASSSASIILNPSSSSASSKSTSSTATNSSTSKSSKAAVIIDITPPSAPSSLDVKLNAFDVVSLSWPAAIDNIGVKSYAIFRNQIQIDVIEAPDTTYIDFNVAANNTYTYGVSAADANGNWSPVTTVITKTPTAPVQPTSSSPSSNSKSSSSAPSNILDTIAPSAPASIKQVAVYANRVDIEWAAATDNIAVTNYNIYRDSLLVKTLSASTLEYSDKTTAPTKQYLYEVESVDAAGNRSLTRKTLFVVTPTAAINGEVKLSWTPPTQREDGSRLTNSELGGFLIRYKSKIDTNYTPVDIKNGAANSHTISGLVGDYDFQIAAYDANGLHSKFISILPQ